VAALKRGINLTMKTRVEIKRSYDRINKVRIENPIQVKEPGKPEYRTSGAVLHGPSQVFYRPEENPRTYIEVDGQISPVEKSVDDPKENRTRRLTYVNILLMTIDGNRGNKIPERRDRPCPCLLKRTAGRTEYGHHIKISGPAKILSSLRKPIRKNVHVWIEAPGGSVECINTGECFCSLRSSPLEAAVWERLCPLRLGHRA
jgi:hypothetical protein